MDNHHNNVPVTPPAPAQSYTLPPLSDLFEGAWRLMTRKIGGLVLLMLAAFAAGIGSFLVAGAVAFAIVFSSGLLRSYRDAESMLTLLPKVPVTAWIALGLVFIAFFAISILVSFFSSVAPLIFLDQAEDRLDLGALFKKSVSLILPLLAVNVITFLLVWGGMFFFFVPAFIIAIFLTFSAYEVILAGKRGRAALRSSAQIVSQHLGPFVIRSLAFFFLSMAVLYLVPQLFAVSFPKLTAIAAIFRMIAQWAVQLYGIVYSYMLYRQLKNATDTARPASISWMVVIAVIGWIIFALIMIAGFQLGLSSLKKSLNTPRSSRGASYSSQKQTEFVSRIPSNCGLSIPLPGTVDTAGKSRHWIYEERTVTRDAFRNLAPEVTGSETVLSAYLNYKSDTERFQPDDKTYVATTGINVLCVNNTKDWALDDFVKSAEKNTKYTAKKNLGYIDWGKIKVYSMFVEGVDANGDYFKEPLNLGVTEDGKRLFLIKIWAPPENDSQAKELETDINDILDGLQYRQVTGDIESQAAPAKKTATAPSCQEYNIREGEFASDKCYSAKDYSDLQYYLNRFNSAALSFNGAVASMNITCDGSDFFKNSCEKDKQEKSQAEADMGNYRTIINGIISRGR